MKMHLNFLYLFITNLVMTTVGNNKLIILVSTPRSLSTVFLRMMDNRGDFDIFNEPGMVTFTGRHFPGTYPVTSYDHVLKNIQDTHQAHNVFVKDMFFIAQEYLINDSFLTNPDCYFVFLVRNPHAACVSYFKKLYNIDKSYDRIWKVRSGVPHHMDYSALYDLYEKIAQKSANKPYVIISEQLVEDPKTVITDFCNYSGIEMKEEYLQWKPYDPTVSTKEKWHDSKLEEHSYYWHDAAITSTHITVPSHYKVDDKGQPTFEEVADETLHKLYKDEYKKNMVYYTHFISEAAQQNL